jgi:hypothetical protein
MDILQIHPVGITLPQVLLDVELVFLVPLVLELVDKIIYGIILSVTGGRVTIIGGFVPEVVAVEADHSTKRRG